MWPGVTGVTGVTSWEVFLSLIERSAAERDGVETRESGVQLLMGMS
jgi:hypothetical protein